MDQPAPREEPWQWSDLRRALLWVYAILATPYFLSGCRESLRSLAGKEPWELLIVSDAPVQAVTVTLDGRRYLPTPSRAPNSGGWDHVRVRGLRPRGMEAVLDVAWRTRRGGGQVAERVRRFDSGPDACLFVLRLDAEGRPVVHDKAGAFHVTCNFGWERREAVAASDWTAPLGIVRVAPP